MTVLEFIKSELKEIKKELIKLEKIKYLDKEFDDNYLPYTNDINKGK